MTLNPVKEPTTYISAACISLTKLMLIDYFNISPTSSTHFSFKFYCIILGPTREKQKHMNQWLAILSDLYFVNTMITNTRPSIAVNQNGAINRCIKTDRLCLPSGPFCCDAKPGNGGGLTVNLILHNIVT